MIDTFLGKVHCCKILRHLTGLSLAEAPEDDRWDFEGLSAQEQADTQAAEPTWPGRTASL